MCLPTSEAACSSLGRGECLSACFRARSNSGGSLAGPEDDEAVKSRLLASGAAEAASQGDLPRLLGLLGWRLPFLACDTVSLDQSFRAACHHFRPGQDRAPSFVGASPRGGVSLRGRGDEENARSSARARAAPPRGERMPPPTPRTRSARRRAAHGRVACVREACGSTQRL